jgi:hypothetical protein
MMGRRKNLPRKKSRTKTRTNDLRVSPSRFWSESDILHSGLFGVTGTCLGIGNGTNYEDVLTELYSLS